MVRTEKLSWGAAVKAVCLVLAVPGAAQTVEYYHLDGIGSVRAVTDQSGQVVERHDNLPFGEEWGPQPGSQPQRFAGEERDSETGLDYFGARYYGAETGRFTAVDPVLTIQANLPNPQRWNRYAYSPNKPFRFKNPDGKIPIDIIWDGANVSHPNSNPPQGHVNNPSGRRSDASGRVVAPESPGAHLRIKTDRQ